MAQRPIPRERAQHAYFTPVRPADRVHPVGNRMHIDRPIVAQASHAVTTDLRLLDDLSYSTRVIGHSNTALVPQKVGNWWLEPVKLSPFTLQPVRTDTRLPPRATKRLRELLEVGIIPRAVVVYHEIPEEERRLSRVERTAIRLHRFAHQELPVVASGLASQSLAHASQATNELKSKAPVVGDLVLKLAQRAAPVVGIVALAGLAALGHLATTTVAVAAAVAVDPLLVVVTEDGYWIEIDRWI